MRRYRDRKNPGTRQIIRAFAAGGACGFLLGALLTIALVSRYGMPRAAASLAGAPLPAQGAHPAAPIDPAGSATRRGEAADIVGTSGAARPTPSPEPVLAPPAAEGLEERDLEMPVEGVTGDDLRRSFSDDRGGRLHEAIDILAPRNTPVKAVEDGTIAKLFFSKAGGITIYQFDPAEEFCYYSAHLERYADGLREGQQIHRGQVIGYVGTSGNAPKDTPHLHFAVFRLTSAKHWWEGTPVDPYDVLR
jgi:murein DD-endopeptidase MepM/ murein hydrolase activator NlpD